MLASLISIGNYKILLKYYDLSIIKFILYLVMKRWPCTQFRTHLGWVFQFCLIVLIFLILILFSNKILHIRLENRYSKHYKFLHGMRIKLHDCVPPMIIVGHQLTMISQHQAAAREYLEAYKLMPESPLINLCVGTFLNPNFWCLLYIPMPL